LSAPAHFATRFILGAGEALMSAGFEPEEVTPQRVVYRNGHVLLAAHWDAAAGAPVVRLGHRRATQGMSDRISLGADYNGLLEAAGAGERLPAGGAADPRITLDAAIAVLVATLPRILAGLPALENRARLGGHRAGLDE